MAKKKATAGKPLVIVESPAKARTISAFLGDRYHVAVSGGQIRDLPQQAAEVPPQYRGEPWATMGVNIEKDFAPLYIVSPEQQPHVAKLKALLAEAPALYLATDEGREGEALCWHLGEVLSPQVPTHRLAFHELTPSAIEAALKNPRAINAALVDAAETRRIIDHLCGHEVALLIEKELGAQLSAGRLESVAARLLIDRERARMAFHPGTWWDLLAVFAAHQQQPAPGFEARLSTLAGRPLVQNCDFNTSTGQPKDDRRLRLDEATALDLRYRLETASFSISGHEDEPFSQRPSPPFTTSSLQQEANRTCGFTARRTMQIAEALYEDGLITSPRTGATSLATEAVRAVRQTVKDLYGADHLPAAPRTYRTTVANTQEAHEAIRPAGTEMPTPESLLGRIDGDGQQLYELIWRRTIACQMTNAHGRQTTLTVEAALQDGTTATFTAHGKTIEFAGFLRAYSEEADDLAADLADKQTILPPLQAGAPLDCRSLQAASHTTQPPARYTEASLTRAFEEKGIGRPSTYAATIDTIQQRGYCRQKGNALVPTWLGFAVSQLLERNLPSLVDYAFTAQMESDLDAISRGETEKVAYLKTVSFGHGRGGLQAMLAESPAGIEARGGSSIAIADDVVVRIGHDGPFLEDAEGRRAPLPPEDTLPPDELTAVKCRELLLHACGVDEPLGLCPHSGLPVYAKNGRYGPYVQLGNAVEGGPKPKSCSLLKGMSLHTLDLHTALRLLTLPRTLGPHPDSGKAITALNGRYGPYVTCDGDSRSLPDELSPLDVTHEQAVELLRQPKGQGRRAASAGHTSLGDSPITAQPVLLRDGRYGPYVSDGHTNASIPSGTDPLSLTLADALALLAARAAAGPRRRGRKKQLAASPDAAGKTAPRTAKKKTAKKKPAKRRPQGREGSPPR